MQAITSVSFTTSSVYNGRGLRLLTYERTMPGSLMVNRHGKRFMLIVPWSWT
jgi:hypothetical protein